VLYAKVDAKVTITFETTAKATSQPIATCPQDATELLAFIHVIIPFSS
jgi:hypothetical protein